MKLVEFVRLITNNEQRNYFEKEFLNDCLRTSISEDVYETWLTKDLAKFVDEYLIIMDSFGDCGFVNEIFTHVELLNRPELCFNFDGNYFRLTRM
jgi:hypothetical protein